MLSGRYGGYVRHAGEGCGGGDGARGARGGGDRDAWDFKRECDRDAKWE